jgi:hypothetical protein
LRLESTPRGDIREHSNFDEARALAIALMMNSLLIGGVAYVFSMQVHESAAVSQLLAG